MYAERTREVWQLATELFSRHREYLLSIARRNASGEADAEEALQEALLLFLRRFDLESGAPPLAWLTLTLKRECWAKRRVQHLDQHAGQEVERGGGSPGSVIEAIPSRASGIEELVTERADARERLAELKPDERTALGYFAAGFSYAEIAERHGWTHTKVNRCIAEGRASLRESAGS